MSKSPRYKFQLKLAKSPKRLAENVLTTCRVDVKPAA